ncbi:hypothetical protein RGAI101_771 [Roseobacter sp. GAI101]|nr:hypothetical protein RGAI101_771 [Roseobacter sp. GAI101]
MSVQPDLTEKSAWPIIARKIDATNMSGFGIWRKNHCG